MEMADDDDDDAGSLVPPIETQVELWLDLRSTALHPRTSVNYLLQELEDDGYLGPCQNSTIKRIIMTDIGFQKLLNSSDSFVDEVEIVYPPVGTTDGFLASSRSGLSLPFGKTLSTLNDNGLAIEDPMEGLRVLGEGRWILLENDEDEMTNSDVEALRIGSLSGFLDLASTASSGQWSLEDSLQKDDGDRNLFLKHDKIIDANGSLGGVAIYCPNKSFLVQVALLLHCFQSASATTVTESGILLQGGADVCLPSLPTAIVLPFDISLWRTAMVVLSAGIQTLD